MHNRKFRGHGVTRVYRKIVFNFCARCWSARRRDCEKHMQWVADPRPRLPESLERYLDQVDGGRAA